MLHPPSWQKDALPTGRGWAHPKTGELLKATRLSTADINDYLGIPKQVAPSALRQYLMYMKNQQVE